MVINSSRDKKSVDKILAWLAANLPPELVDQPADFNWADISSALEHAAARLRQPEDWSVQTGQVGVEAASAQSSGDLDLNKILIVDDVKENLFLIEYLFRKTEFSLSLASSAQEALAKARTELPIMIISDIMMPGMSGFELLTALKQDERTKNMGVILVTAHHRSSKEVSEGLKMGADDYIYRPFVREEFMSRVEAVLRLKRAEAETQRQARVLAQRNKGLAWLNELAVAVNSSLDAQEIFSFSMHAASYFNCSEFNTHSGFDS